MTLTTGRIDQGADFGGSGPVPAVADGVVEHVGLWPGWPGIGGVVYRSGNQRFYVMENFRPSVRVGQQVKKGQALGTAVGSYPYIEYGLANQAGTGPAVPYNGLPDGTPTAGGKAFASQYGQVVLKPTAPAGSPDPSLAGAVGTGATAQTQGGGLQIPTPENIASTIVGWVEQWFTDTFGKAILYLALVGGGVALAAWGLARTAGVQQPARDTVKAGVMAGRAAAA